MPEGKWDLGEESAGTDLDEVTGSKDAPLTWLNENVDAVLMDEVMNGVGSEGASPLPDAGRILSADAYPQSLWGGGGVGATEADRMRGASEDSHDIR